MGMLGRFERRLGGLVEGAFAKVFKGGVEPVELAAKLAEEADRRKVLSKSRTLVPNDYVVELGEADYERLSPYADPLGAELADMVTEHAQRMRYSFAGPVSVTFELEPTLAIGVFRIQSGVSASSAPAVDQTQVAPLPTAGPVTAHLVVKHGADDERTVALDQVRVRIGRGADADVQLADTSVSRLHGEVVRTAHGHRYVDLDSTNGSVLNGTPISEADLEDGDHITLGTASLTYHLGSARASR